MVPKVPETPDAVAGPLTGGQFCAQVPLQLDLAGVSGAKEYSVKPCALVSTVAPPMVAVFRVLPAVVATGLLVLVLVLVLPLAEDEPDELHAARTAAAAATASSTSSIRRRAGPLLIRRALPLPSRPEILSVAMTSCPFSWQLAPKGEHASFADAQEYGREYRPPDVKRDQMWMFEL